MGLTESSQSESVTEQTLHGIECRPNGTQSIENRQRFLTIDALRGVGALGVMSYHLAGNLTEYDWAPSWADRILDHGNLGVPLFFVISGFVISHSTDRHQISTRFLGRFALKRSIRLDPTYWCAIVLSLILLLLKLRLFPGEGGSLPSWQGVLVHAFYLQDLLRVPPISPVFWTLCLEIQFYLFFVCSRLLFSKFNQGSLFVEIWFLGIFLFSMLLFFGVLQNPVKGLFIDFWYLFYLGLAARRFLSDRSPSALAASAAVAVVAIFLCFRPEPYGLAGLFTTLFVTAARKQKKLSVWLACRPLLYLGSISYSLYLVHPEIGWSTISLSKRLFPGMRTDVSGGLFFFVGTVASVAAAHLLWYLVERPTCRFASRLRYTSKLD